MAEDTGLASSDVSAGDDANASQYNNLRADTKKMRQEEFNAGATIAGDTLPVPVYQNTSDNEVYACDADDTDKLNFIGFAISDGTNGNAIIVQHTGIVGGFSGLDEGEKYYVQDAVGTIGKTPGTVVILVGIAISATELLVLRETSHTNGQTTYDLSTASGVQNIAHGLGKIPKKIKIKGFLINAGSDGTVNCETIYNGKIQSSVGEYFVSGFTIGNFFRIGPASNNLYQTGVVTFDATNIIINWTKLNNPSGTLYLLWEAEA